MRSVFTSYILINDFLQRTSTNLNHPYICTPLYFQVIIETTSTLALFQDCNNFQAGDRVGAKIKNQKLDVTGVFGSICKHEVPLLFLDMHHGERYK